MSKYSMTWKDVYNMLSYKKTVIVQLSQKTYLSQSGEIFWHWAYNKYFFSWEKWKQWIISRYHRNVKIHTVNDLYLGSVFWNYGLYFLKCFSWDQPPPPHLTPNCFSVPQWSQGKELGLDGNIVLLWSNFRLCLQSLSIRNPPFCPNICPGKGLDSLHIWKRKSLQQMVEKQFR